MAVQLPIPGSEAIGPLGLIGEQPAPVIAPQGIDPLAAQKRVVVDEFAEFENATPAPQTTPPAPDEFAEFAAADDLDIRSSEELTGDRDTFNPVTYFEQNPGVASDPAKLAKLLQVYRKRREEGLDAGQVAKAAVKETPGLVTKMLGGVRDLGARAIDLTVQPVVNVIGAGVTGDLADPQRRKAFFTEARGELKKAVGEVSAGTESATVGIVDLSRQGARKAASLPGIESRGGIEGLGIGQVGEKFVPPAPKTDQDLLKELADDVAFRKQATDILGGEGEAAKNFGLDQETLSKEGITLDKEAIESLSLVDPLTMVAGAGVFKLVSAGGKVLASARTLSGVEKVAEGLGKVAKSTTEKVVGRTIQGAGKLTTKTGEAIRFPGLVSATTIGSIMAGNPVPTSIATGLAVRGASKAARVIGPKIDAAGAKIATEGNLAINALAELPGAAAKVAEGAALGAASTAPLAVLTDDDQAAGAILGAGIALGAVGAGAERGFKVVKSKAAQTLFGPNRTPIPDVPSAAYGRDSALDLSHQENIAKLPEADRAEVNNFRELVRPGGGEIYVTDRATFRQKIADTFAAETGRELTPESLNTYEKHHAFFDAAGPGGEKIVYLNSDNTGLAHDSGHVFDALLPEETRKDLRDAVKKAFPEDEFTAFKKLYEERAGTKITDEAALSEFVAEQFSAIFKAVPVTELAAPKTLLSKFGNALAEQAEKWGVDLTGGTTTPDLGAPVSVGIRTMFRDAARTISEAGNPQGTKGPLVEPPPPSNVVAFPGAEVSSPQRTPPTTPEPPAPTPPAPVSPNIRVTTAQQDAFSNRNSETGVARARELAAADKDPAVATRVDEISKSLESGNPVLEISHLGIASETPAARRDIRVGEQTAGYAELDRLQINSRAEAPASIVNTHQKTFVPVRWTNQGGTPTLLAMSLDKVISNVHRVATESVGKGVDASIPYAMENGKFTDDAWTKIIEDNKAYGENHANGYRGDGKKLVRPGVDVGLSIPAENPNYTPKILSEEVMNFQNLIQGLNTPATAREVRGKIPRNVKNQILAQANKRTLLEPASIRPRNAGKQAFVSFPGKTVKEVNPMRNELVAKGVNVDSLIPVTEQIRAKDITSVRTRSDLNFKAPVTDIVGGGFLPSPEEVSQIKAVLLESQKVGDLDSKTFMSAFRDKYFLDWQDHPSFEEITQKFPNSDLKEAYEALRKEFNGYFKYDNEQAALKFKEAAGDPQKESAAADFAVRQWGDTSEQLDSRLYALLRDEPKVKRPKDVVRTTYWLSPEGEIYEERYPHAMGDYFTRANLNLPKEKALEAGWAQVVVGEAPVEGAGLVSVEGTKITPSQKFALERISKSVGMEVVSKSGESVAGGGVPVKPPTGITQKSLETVDWSEIRRNLQEKDPKNVGPEFGTGGDIYQVEDIIESLILNPEKSPNSFPKQHQQALRELLRLGREQILERGESPGLFLPATEFRRKSLAGKTVEEFSDYVFKSSPQEWKAATDNMTGGLTGGAWGFGLSLKEAGDVGVLKTYQEKLSAAAKEAMKNGDFDAAYSLISKSQFFREAWEASTGSGSAGAAFKRGTMGTEGVKVPFPIEEQPK